MQRESSITSVSPNDKAINNTATKKQPRSLRTIAMLLTLIPGAMVAGTLVAPDIASAREVTCRPVQTSDGYSTTFCRVSRGEVRLRSDCKNYPDKYSGWKGRGNHTLITGKCRFGIRGGVVETRN